MVVCTGPFIDSAHLHAQMLGREGFQPVVIQHPLGGLKPDGVMQRALEAEKQIVAALTMSPDPHSASAVARPKRPIASADAKIATTPAPNSGWDTT